MLFFVFLGKGCPHCAKVEKFIEENNILLKVQFETREVYYNKRNAKLLGLIAKEKCSLSEDKIGVPFLWTGSNCIVGDEAIISYFQRF